MQTESKYIQIYVCQTVSVNIIQLSSNIEPKSPWSVNIIQFWVASTNLKSNIARK